MMPRTDSRICNHETSFDLTEQEVDHLAKVAKRAADAAGEVIRIHYFGQELNMTVDDEKGDGPVTVAAREAELSMVSTVLASFPSHVVFGQVTGWTSKQYGKRHEALVPNFVWILSPIDNTASFVKKELKFGILVGLLYKGNPVLGIIDQPVVGDRWQGVVGRRTVKNGEEVKTRACEGLEGAVADIRAPELIADCVAYGKLASGLLDVVVECALQPFDLMALIPVVKGAGGEISDWEGKDISWKVSEDPCRWVPEMGFKVVASGDKRVHQQVLMWLSQSKHLGPSSEV